MFKKIFNILALTTLASQSVHALISIKEQCQIVNNILGIKESMESCCFNDRVVCSDDMKNIIQLDFSDLGLTTVDEDITKLPLVALDLSGNKGIKKLPSNINDLARLEILNLSDLPNLTELPNTTTLLKNLSILMLNNDISLKQLPVNIGNLSNLNQLYAISSGLEILPVTIVNLSNLVIVNFSSCKNLYGKVPDLPENVICDYSGTNLCHYQYEEYPNKWAIPADIFCEKVNISPVNMGTSVNNKFAVINNINTVDDNDAEKDIRCGKEFGTSCPAGECCSKYGYCGFSDAHCKIENKCQPEYGLCIDKEGNKIEPDVEEKPATTTTTTAKPVATTTKEESKPTSTTHQSNRCGKGYGACGRGLCCSRYGWCGTTEEFCSVSTCQNEYGVCWAKDPASNKNKNTQGRCGKSYGKCPSGQCCSKYGWCGTSESYCAANKCQSQYGKCSNTTVTNNDTIIRDDGRCGEGFGRCAPGTCCSKYGWCGTEDIFCKVKSGCQPNYGFCKA